MNSPMNSPMNSRVIARVIAPLIEGVVTEFDDDRGLGTVLSDDGVAFLFHVIEIADGTRSIDVGQAVRFEPLPRFGTLQAGAIHTTQP